MTKKVAEPALEHTALYIDPDSGRTISTNSMLKTFRRCPKQAEYKYFHRLKPKSLSLPLTRGKWMHALLEAHYRCQMPYDGWAVPQAEEVKPWEDVHAKYTSDFHKMFDEEKDKLGDLPTECAALMRGYLWHYKNEDAWTIHGVEGTLETLLPDGSIFRGRYDMLVEDEYGLWLVDHKTHKTLPNLGFRLLDSQSALYLWAARQEGMKIQGFIWNYIKTTGLKKPTMILDGSRLSTPSMRSCDFPTAARALKEYKLDITPYKPWLRSLKNQRYVHGEPQTSPFFQRSILEKSDEMLDRVVQEYFHTSMRMHDYDFSQRDAVERVVDRSCTYMCSYTDLCQTELFGGNTELMLRKNFTVGDPMSYYYDDGIIPDEAREN